MNTYIFKTDKMPKCKDCGKDMGYWDLREDQNSYQCVGCTSDYISDSLIKVMKDMLEGKLTK